MISPELQNYIKKARERGVTDEAIRGILKNNGWSDADISEGEKSVPENVLETLSPPTPSQFLSSENNPPVPADLAEATSPSVRRSPLKTFIVFVLGVFVLGGAGVFAYPYFEEYLGVDPQKKIIDSFLNLQKQSGMTIDGALLLKNEDADITLELQGSFLEKEVLKRTGTISLKVYHSPKDSLDGPSEPIQFNIILDTRVIGKTLYVSINKDTNFSLLDFFGLGELKGKWITISLKDIESFNRGPKIDIERAGLTQEEVENIHKKYEETERIVIEEKRKEKIEGQNVEYYAFHFGPEMESFLADLIRESLVKQGKTAKEIEEGEAAFRESFLNVRTHRGQVWMKDDLPHKFSFEANFVPPENKYSQGKEMTLNLDISFKDFNKDIVVEIPEGSRMLEEIMGEIFGGASLSTSTPEL